MLQPLVLFGRSTVLDYRARWHYHRLARHDRLMRRHGLAIRALTPTADQIRRSLHA
jgi:hypothetical protein